MKNIFVAFTPYHILLSCSIALDYSQNDENFLFIFSNFSEAETLGRILRNWTKSPFKQIYILPGIYKKNIFEQKFIVRKHIKIIQNFIRNLKIDNIYVFNDAWPETQALFYYAKKNNKNVVGIYIEDGAGVYNSFLLKKKNCLKLLLSKIFYGIWYKDVVIIGTSQWINRVMAIFPQFVRPELRVNKIIPIKKDNFLKIIKDEVFHNYITSLKINIDKLKKIDVLLILTHSDLIRQFPRYKEAIREIFNIFKTLNLKIAIKYHPSEPLEDFLSVSGEKDILILPKSVPVELFYNFMSEIKFIIGDTSTSLLTGKWLLEKPEIISISRLLNYFDKYLFNVFRKLDIKLVNNIEEIKNIILKT